MRKLLAGVMVVGGCVGWGWLCRAEMVERVKLLKELYRMVSIFEREIQYGKSSLPEICRLVAERMPSPIQEALLSIFEEMQRENGADFAKVFASVFEENLKKTVLGENDRRLIANMTANLHSTDVEQQLRQLAICREELVKEIEKAEESFTQKGTAAVGLGVFGGLTLVLILC